MRRMKLTYPYWKMIIFCLVVPLMMIKGTPVEDEIQEIMEMVPYDKVTNTCLEYTIRDPQVKLLLSYISEDTFRQNLAEFESSQEFEDLVDVAKMYNIDVNLLIRKFKLMLNMLPGSEIQQLQQKINTSKQDLGVIGLIKELKEIMPLSEMKQAFRYKLHTNPQFKLFVEGIMRRVLTGEMRRSLQPVLSSKPFQVTIRDLKVMGLPLEQICNFIRASLIDFFNLGTSVEAEIQELLEMVPYDKVLEICMEYAISDLQVKSLLTYICGEQFKHNLAEMEDSEEFERLANAAQVLHIDAYSIANKFMSALNALPNGANLQQHVQVRRRRSPGDGLPGLVREAMEITPLSEMKEAYKYKLENNPQLKVLEQSIMERIFSGEVRQYLEPLIKSKPFQDTKKDLEDMGLPLEQIQEFIELKLTEFFDLEQTAIKLNNNNNNNNKMNVTIS